MSKKPIILLSRKQTPDGTILVSRHKNDCAMYTDKNGDSYLLDGGRFETRMSINEEPMIDISITTDTPHEVIREHVQWGCRGKDGRSPLEWRAIKDLSTDHIEAIIKTQRHIDQALKNVFIEELDLRKQQLEN